MVERNESENALREGSQVNKHNGKYYLLMIEWTKNSLRRQVCYRADNIEGPYEKRVILEHNFQNFGGVGQGCLIDPEDGDWYAMIFQDRGGIGRVPNLMPCRWVDGWPMLGDENGHVPVEMNSPVKGDVAVEPIIKSDNFTADYLGKNWQWNHNPDNEAWSLTERPGYLRLKTSRVVDNIFTAPNTISQRTEGPKCTGVVAMDISGMKDGDVAGFSAFNGHSGFLSVIKDGKNNYLTMSTNVVNRDYQNERKVKSVDEEIFETVEIPQDKVYLRIDCDFLDRRDIATFYYSLDNENWSKIGTDFKMRFDYMKLFMGTRYAIFNYAGKSTGGYVDIESFDFEKTL